MTTKTEILNYVAGRNHVSFVEITNKFGKGDIAIEMKKHLIVGFGMSEEVQEIVTTLLATGELAVLPCSSFIYFLDGCMLTLPIAKSFRDYKQDHWAPCLLYTRSQALEYLNSLRRKCKSKKERADLDIAIANVKTKGV